MRVVGGEWRGRPLAAPAGRGTRPTSDRVREAIFDVITSLVISGRLVAAPPGDRSSSRDQSRGSSTGVATDLPGSPTGPASASPGPQSGSAHSLGPPDGSDSPGGPASRAVSGSGSDSPGGPASRAASGSGPLAGHEVLDLYAGSGALGIEALSRGADRCTFVESSSGAVSALRKNLTALGVPAERASVRSRKVAAALESDLSEGRQYTVVLADAPYAAYGAEEPMLAALLPRLVPQGLVVVETAKARRVRLPFETVSEKTYGDTRVTFLVRAAQISDDEPTVRNRAPEGRNEGPCPTR